MCPIAFSWSPGWRKEEKSAGITNKGSDEMAFFCIEDVSVDLVQEVWRQSVRQVKSIQDYSRKKGSFHLGQKGTVSYFSPHS